MITAYKAFHKDLTCTMGRGTFQYEEGKWFEEPEANCRRNGFHCAENPLDCLSYYGDMENSVYYLVLADGDINEDGSDSKISCTRMKLVKRLDKERFVMHAMRYLYEHPQRKSAYVQEDKGTAERDFVIVRGKNPAARGRAGTILGLLKESEGSRQIEEMAVYTAGEQGIEPMKWYGIDGREEA